jgi:hypothetical protein
MKKLIVLLFAFTVYSFVSVQAQPFEGKTVTQTTMVTDPSAPLTINEPTITTTWTKGSRSRMEIKSPLMGDIITITDYDKKESVTLLNMMGKKIALVSPLDEAQKLAADAGSPTLPKDMTCNETGKTKTILGYTCHEAQCTYSGKSGTIKQMSAWYCKDINTHSQQHNSFAGMPFEYSMKSRGMTMNVTTLEISKEPVSDDSFVIPQDYTISTPEEMMQNMHGK